MTETTYPAWQENIRKAQIAQQILDEVAADKEREEQAKVGAEHGRNLARVLEVAFGIKVEPPLKNDLVLDGFRFWLKTERINSEWGNTPLFYELKESAPDENDGEISFTLYVNAIHPEDVELIERIDHWTTPHEFIVRRESIRQDWTYLRAQLAAALDDLRSVADFIIQTTSKRPTEDQSASLIAHGSKPSVEQLLRDIFTEIAKEAAREVVEGINDAVDY